MTRKIEFGQPIQKIITSDNTRGYSPTTGNLNNNNPPRIVQSPTNNKPKQRGIRIYMSNNPNGLTRKTALDGYRPSEGKLNPSNPPKIEPKSPKKQFE